MSEKKISVPTSVSEFKDTSRKYILRKREEIEAAVELHEFFGRQQENGYGPHPTDSMGELTNKHGD